MVNSNRLIYIKFHRTVKECENASLSDKDTAHVFTHVLCLHNYKHDKNCCIYKVRT